MLGEAEGLEDEGGLAGGEGAAGHGGQGREVGMVEHEALELLPGGLRGELGEVLAGQLGLAIETAGWGCERAAGNSGVQYGTAG